MRGLFWKNLFGGGVTTKQYQEIFLTVFFICIPVQIPPPSPAPIPFT